MITLCCPQTHTILTLGLLTVSLTSNSLITIPKITWISIRILIVTVVNPGMLAANSGFNSHGTALHLND